MSQRRQEAPAAPSAFDDVVDPHRGSEATYRRSAAQLLPGVEQASRVLHLTLARWPRPCGGSRTTSAAARVFRGIPRWRG